MGWIGLWGWIAALVGGMFGRAAGEGRAQRFDAVAQRLAGGDCARAGAADRGVEGGGTARGDGTLAARRYAASVGFQVVRDARDGMCAGAGLHVAQFGRGAGSHHIGERQDADVLRTQLEALWARCLDGELIKSVADFGFHSTIKIGESWQWQAPAKNGILASKCNGQSGAPWSSQPITMT